MEEDLLYPEKVYFRNSVVVGDLPKNVDFNKLFSYFDDVSFWKLTGKKIIPDLRNNNMKAVILTYEDEESARMSNIRLKISSNISSTLYDGVLLFYYCKQLDLTCDVRSRNVLISGVNYDKPKDTYYDLLAVFGTISYIEFCSEGEIPKVRVEYTRATSAFAAVLSLQDRFGRDSVVSLEISLFPVHPIGPCQNKSTSAPKKSQALNPSPVAQDIKEQTFMLCTMNVYQDRHAFTSINGMLENVFHQEESVEEYMMEAVAFGMSRKLYKDKVNYHRLISKFMQDCLDRNAQENLKRFLQSAKKIMSFNSVWNEMIVPLTQHKM